MTADNLPPKKIMRINGMEKSASGETKGTLLRIGGMATMPSRWKSFKIALTPILKQVDQLYLYLDKYTHIPAEISAERKIIPLLPQEGEKHLCAAGKFACLNIVSKPFLYFGFDDDIIYPATYVDHLAAALHRLHYRALVGIHGSIYAMPCTSYVRKRRVLHFKKALSLDCVVDELGSGTLAFHSNCINIDPGEWICRTNVDLMVMLDAIRQEVPRIAVRRPWRFLKPIKQCQKDSIYRALRTDDRFPTRILQAAMADYPGRWCLSD